MKKKLFALSLLFSAFTVVPALAQGPVLTLSNVITPLNTSFLYQGAMTSGITFGSTGENQVWDYTHLVDSGMVDSIVYVNPAGTPGAQLFPEATTASVENIAGQQAYNYTQISSGGMSGIGSLSPGDTERYVPPMKIMTFPFSYGSSFADNGMYYDNSSTPGVDSGQAFTKARATGYGTLKLPGGHTYHNVLQVTDSLRLLVSNIGVTLTMATQTYYAEFANLLTITYTGISGFGTTENSRDVTYLASPLSLGITNVTASQTTIQVAPNPTDHFIDINVSGPDVMEVFSITGKRIFRQKIQAGKNRIDVSRLPSGHYFGRMNHGCFRFIKK